MEKSEEVLEEAMEESAVGESGIYSEGDMEMADDAELNGEPEETDIGGTSEDENTDADPLEELCRVSGKAYKSLSEFPGHERFLQLLQSGVLTAEEAYYAVNRRETVVGTATNGGKRHMSVSRRKPSSGEVFTRADREELAKWGISATGSELERLWREAGGRGACGG